MSTTAPQTRHTVTAVIVTHDGADVLPGLFRALAAQTHPVERVVGVDTGSNDHSGSLLRKLLGDDAVLSAPRSAGFGEAVTAGLGHPAARRALPAAPDTRRVEWIWLLHDDCEPSPDALERLIRVAGRDRTVVILGPKVLDGTDRRTLRETGISIDRAGRRITGIETGEIDQGQHDGNRPVLAVGSAGMLIRRDVWEQLGGFDSRLKLFRDDIDFCWRAHAAGHRVHVVTDAVLYHRELSARPQRGGRGGLLDRPGLRRMNRRNALYVLAVNLPLPQMFAVLAGCVAGSLLRTAWYLLTKQEELAQAHLLAVTWLFLHPFQVLSGRRLRASGRQKAYGAVRSYIPPGQTPQRIAETIAGLVTSGPVPVTGGRHQALPAGSSEGSFGDDVQFTDQPSLISRIIRHPAVQLVAALTLVTLIAERRLLADSPLGGGALVPAWNGASGLWSEYLAGFHGTGLGSSASAPPYLAVVAALGTILGGHAWLAVDILLLGCVPLAGITAYLAARRLVTSTVARVLLAATYAVAPVAMGAVASGRLGTAVAFVLLPLIGINAGRMLTSAPKAARRGAWATGLLVALAAAFDPAVWLIAVVLTAVAVVIRRWTWPVSRIDAAIVVLSPVAVLFPWSFHLLASPSALLGSAGVAFGSSAASPAGSLLLSPGGPGAPPVWVTAGLALAVAAAFLAGFSPDRLGGGRPGGPGGRRALVGAGWAVAAAGYLIAIVMTRSGDGWPGAALAVAAVGLLTAAAPAVQWLCELSRRQISWPVLAAAGALPVAAAAFWIAGGVRGPIAPRTQQVLPAFVAASSAGPSQYRTLVLRPSSPGGVAFSVLRAGDPSLGEPELTEPAAATRAISRQVAALVAPDGADSGDPGQSLGSFGVHWVLVPGPVDQSLAERLNAASGLVPLSSSSADDLWQVTGTVARARVTASNGAVTPVTDGGTAPSSGGTLVLAEPHGGWTATLNGAALRPLPKPVDGWAQGFTLPKGGGRLGISRSRGNLPRVLSLIFELVTLLVIVVLAIPGRREDPAQEAEAIAAVRAAQHERRVERAAKTRKLTRAAAARAMDSGVASRAVSGLVAGLPPGSRSGAGSGSGAGAASGRRLGRILRAAGPRRKSAAQPPSLPPLALPPGSSPASSDSSSDSWSVSWSPVPPEAVPSEPVPSEPAPLPSPTPPADSGPMPATAPWEPAARPATAPWGPAAPPVPAPWEAPGARAAEPPGPAEPPSPAGTSGPELPRIAPGESTPVQPTPMQLIPLTPPEREGRGEHGRRGGRHGKPRGRRKGRGGEL